jgi:hypothetical protein
MKTFYIKASMTTYLETTIEAENEDEAWSIAQDMDGGDFTAIDNDGCWDILTVNEITSGEMK